jgi:hypothetical protein
MIIYVQKRGYGLKPEIIKIEVEGNDTILDIKKKIYSTEMIPEKHQKLSFKYNVLENNKCVSDYKIKQNHVIQFEIVHISGEEKNLECAIQCKVYYDISERKAKLYQKTMPWLKKNSNK